MGGVWGGVCSRFSGAHDGGSIVALCLQANASHWQLVDFPTVYLAGGKHAMAAPSTSIQLELKTAGSVASVSIGGQAMGSWTTTAPAGLFGLISGWNEAEFDGFSMVRSG